MPWRKWKWFDSSFTMCERSRYEHLKAWCGRFMDFQIHVGCKASRNLTCIKLKYREIVMTKEHLSQTCDKRNF